MIDTATRDLRPFLLDPVEQETVAEAKTKIANSIQQAVYSAAQVAHAEEPETEQTD